MSIDDFINLKTTIQFHISSCLTSYISFLLPLFRSAISSLLSSFRAWFIIDLLPYYTRKHASNTLNFSFIFLMFKNLFNCKSHTPEQQREETSQVDSQISSKPSHASSPSFHLLNLRHFAENKTSIPKR